MQATLIYGICRHRVFVTEILYANLGRFRESVGGTRLQARFTEIRTNLRCFGMLWKQRYRKDASVLGVDGDAMEQVLDRVVACDY